MFFQITKTIVNVEEINFINVEDDVLTISFKNKDKLAIRYDVSKEDRERIFKELGMFLSKVG